MPFIFNPLSGGFDFYQSGSGGGNSFTIWQPDHGTSPTASSSTDTMDVTSSDSSITITGNSSTKSLNFQLAAGIALNMLAALNHSVVPVTDSSGFLTNSAVSATTLAFLDATSSVQAQLNGKQATGSYLTALTGEVSASGPGSAAATLSTTAVTGKVLTGFVSGAGTVAAADSILQAFNKLVGNQALKAPLASPSFTGTIGTALTGSKVLQTDSSGNLQASGVSTTTLAFLDATSSIQTQLNLLAPKASPAFTGTIGTALTASKLVVTDASSNLATSTFQDAFDPTTGYWLYEDWDVAGTAGRLSWTRTLTATGTSSLSSDNAHPGINILKASANADAAVFNLSAGTFIPGGGTYTFQCNVRFANLSGVLNAGADTYLFRIGLNSGGAVTTDGNNIAYFQYDQVTDGNFFDICCRNNGGTKQKTVTSQAIVANTWYRLKMVINAAASSIDFFVNEVNVGTLSSQVPVNALAPYIMLLKNGGSAQITAENDFIWVKQTLTSAR